MCYNIKNERIINMIDIRRDQNEIIKRLEPLNLNKIILLELCLWNTSKGLVDIDLHIGYQRIN